MRGWKITIAALVMLSIIAWVIFLPRYSKFIPDTSITVSSLSANDIQQIRQNTPITEVQVFKAKREINLLHQNQTIRTYPIRLGFNPLGHKTQEGDGKTPEGRYVLDWRNPKSQFYKSLHISYPNQADLAQAKARGVSAGGDVMIHGSTNSETAKLPKMMEYLPQNDWTWGCVAVRNVDIDEIWQLVDNGTAIEIFP